MNQLSGGGAGMQWLQGTCLNMTELNTFHRNVQTTIKKLYSYNDISGIRCYTEQQIEALDRLTSRHYAKAAKDVVRDSAHLVPYGLPSYASMNLRKPVYQSDHHAESRTYAWYFKMLAFSSDVKVYRFDNYTGVHHVDIMLLSYHLYNILYLGLIDALACSYEWQAGTEALMELSVVLYLVRVDLLAFTEGWNRASLSPSEKANEALTINDALIKRGIYLSDTRCISDHPGILGEALGYCMKEQQLETWSRTVMLWLHSESFYSSLEVLGKLPLPFRCEILQHIKLPALGSGETEQSEGDCKPSSGRSRCKNGSICSNKISVRRGCGRRNVRYKHLHKEICSYILSLNTSYRRYALEGFMMITHISRDIQYGLYRCLFFSVYIAARMSRLSTARKSNLTITDHSKYTSNEQRGDTRPLDHDTLVLHYVSAHEMGDTRVDCLYSGIYKFWRTFNGTVSRIDLRVNSVLRGVSKYHGHGVHSLERLIMMDVDSATMCDAAFIDVSSSEIRKGVAKNKRESPEAHVNNPGLYDIHGWKLGVNNPVNLMACHKSLGYALMLKGSHNRRLGGTKSVKEKFNLHNSVQTMASIEEPLVPGCENSLVLLLIAFCFTIDRPYIILHFKQSLEFLNYTDTLKNKHKRFIRKLLPWIPVMNSAETRSILKFQKYIKTTFKSKRNDAYCRILNDGKLYPRDHQQDYHFTRSYTSPPAIEAHAGNGAISSLDIAEGTLEAKSDVEEGSGRIISRFRGTFNRAAYGIEYAKTRINRYCKSLKKAFSDRFATSIANCGDLKGGLQSWCKPRCEHTSVNQFMDECQLCSKEDSFEHIDRMTILIDWFAHFLFTGCIPALRGNIGVAWRRDMSHRSCSEVTRANVVNDPRKTDAHINGDIVWSNIREETTTVYDSPTRDSIMMKNQIKRTRDPLGLLNEMLETTVLVSLATCFHEHQYNRLLFRLAIVQALQGRWSLCLALIKQLKGNTSGYAVPFKRECIQSDAVPNLTSMEDDFSSLLASKILVELMQEPQLAIGAIIGKEEHPYMKGEHHLTACMREQPVEGCYSSTKGSSASEAYPMVTAKKYLTLGVSYLQLCKKQICPNSESISDVKDSILHIDHPGLDPIEHLEFSEIASDSKYSYDYSSVITEKPLDIEKPSVMAADYIMKSISLDPNSFKAWVYLAHCALRNHDLYFARNCCEKSIECYNTSLSAWLTIAVVLSARTRSCSPIPTSKTVWQEYLIKKKEEQNDIVIDHPKRLIIPAVPVPFDCVMSIGDEKKIDLDIHMNRSVGGDVSEVLNKLITATRLGTIFPYTAILQLCSRVSGKCVDSFPWEASHTSQMQINLVEIIQTLRGCIAFHSMRTVMYKGQKLSDCDANQLYVVMKNLVSRAVADDMYVSSFPFIWHMIRVFSPEIMSSIFCEVGYAEDAMHVDGMKHMPCAEEIYGWVTYLEVLSQCGHAEMAQIMLPLMDSYVKAYRLPDPEVDHRSFSAIVQENGQSDAFRSAEARYHLGEKPVLATDIVVEAAFIKAYVRCFVTKESELGLLLSEVQQACTQLYSRKLQLLECRILAGLQEYSQSALCFSVLLKKGFICEPSTDYLLEYRAMKIYSGVLYELGMSDEAAVVDSFAEQCYLSTPILKCDLCLVDPL